MLLRVMTVRHEGYGGSASLCYCDEGYEVSGGGFGGGGVATFYLRSA